MDITVNQIFKQNGYLRQVLSLTRDMVEIKTIGVPACRAPGRPPKSGLIKIASVKKWIKKKRDS